MNFESLITPYSVGIDACKAGWFVVAINRRNQWAIQIFADVGQIWHRLSKGSSLILIDIPIGIPEKDSRICDGLARKLLRKRASCVFPVPCRRTLTARTYQEACRINSKLVGKKLSLQSWNIIPKSNQGLAAAFHGNGLLCDNLYFERMTLYCC